MSMMEIRIWLFFFAAVVLVFVRGLLTIHEEIKAISVELAKLMLEPPLTEAPTPPPVDGRHWKGKVPAPRMPAPTGIDRL